MSSLHAVGRVIDALEAAQIPYLLVGAFASNVYGFARSTKDAVFVVTLRDGDLDRLVDLLGDDFRIDRQLQFEVLTKTLRNVLIYRPTGFEIDLFRMGDDAHHIEQSSRHVKHSIGELSKRAWIPTAEDVIIQKLRWQREKDIVDVRNILGVNFERLDWEYLTRWTTEHTTLDLLERLRDETPRISLDDIDD